MTAEEAIAAWLREERGSEYGSAEDLAADLLAALERAGFNVVPIQRLTVQEVVASDDK